MCIDQNERENILGCTEPYVLVDASAGTGKTTMMVQKAFWSIAHGELKHYQRIALITFTRFATQQIRDKIQEFVIDEKNASLYDAKYSAYFHVSTNNGFVLSEVIRPFLRDAYGKEYPKPEEWHQEFGEKYKFKNFNEGMEQLKNNHILGSFKETKQDFNFQLALNILRYSSNSRKYLQSRYPIIFVDEYQDCSPDMHRFFMYLKNDLHIKLFIVGDIKQAIYGFRGANPEIFKKLGEDSNFKRFELIHNFRSHSAIVNFSNAFVNRRSQIPVKESRVILCKWRQFWALIQNLPKDLSCVYLIDNQWNAQKVFKVLKDKQFKYLEDPPLNTSYSSFDVLDPLLKYYHDNQYTKFEALSALGLEHTKKNIRSMEQMKLFLKDSKIEQAFKEIFYLIERSVTDEEKRAFKDSLDDKWKVQFSKVQPKRQIMTIHASKGLDFDIVFVDSSSFYYRGKFNDKNHYVAITRPKEYLVLNIDEKQYEKYLQNLNLFQLNGVRCFYKN